MSTQKLLLKPGITTQATPTLAEGTYSQSQFIRWKDGLLQKLGGWQHITPSPFATPVRGCHAWADLNDNDYLVGGSIGRLQLLTGGEILDITPLRATVDMPVAFSTTSGLPLVSCDAASNGEAVNDWIEIVTPVAIGGLTLVGFKQVTALIDANNFSFIAGQNATGTVANGGAVPLFTVVITSNIVTVTFAAHGQLAGAIYNVPVSTVVGGITIFGDYIIQTVVDADHFTIAAAQTATSSTSGAENGGNVRINYLIPAGRASAALVTGYGAGGYGLGPYGGPNTGTTFLSLRQWAIDNYGQDMIACPTDGPIYRWHPPAPSFAVAAVLPNAPTMNTWIFTAMPQQQIMAVGAEVNGIQDHLLVRYSDAGDPEDWTATQANQAGSFRLSTGSKIIGALQVAQQAFIWTDVGLWVAQYTGVPFVYSFSEVGKGCGLIAARARAIVGDKVVWMSGSKFMIYDGGINELPCDVWDFVFRNLDTDQADKIVMGANSDFEEIMVFFPAASGDGEVDSYVKYRFPDQTMPNGAWDYGMLDRTAWIDKSILGPPIGFDIVGNAQQHETGNDADGSAMDSYAVTGFVDVSQGTFYWRIDQIIPDFILQAGSVVLLTLMVQDYPNGPITFKGPFPVTSSTQYITIQGGARGRQIAFRIESMGLGSFWRQGAIRYRGSPDGRL